MKWLGHCLAARVFNFYLLLSRQRYFVASISATSLTRNVFGYALVASQL